MTSSESRIAADPIADIECFDCRVPLPNPLRVGASTVTHRFYSVVRVRTESGAEGAAFAFGRGLPIASIIDQTFAPMVRGTDARLHENVGQQLRAAFWSYSEGALFSVAVSALDLALWDLAARRLGAPLADLLGCTRTEVPMCAVVSYANDTDGDGVDALVSEVEGYLSRGFKAIKLVVGARSPREDESRMAAVRKLAGDDVPIVLDAFRSFGDVQSALTRLRLLMPYEIAYLEDPFSESLEPLVSVLRKRSGLAIGLGESLGGEREHRRLLEAGIVDVLRCDVSVVGGVRAFLSCAALASAQGLHVSPHAHPELHVQLAAAVTNLYGAGIEYMDPARGLDALHRLLTTELEIVDGSALLPERPGFGFEFDWEAVQRYAI